MINIAIPENYLLSTRQTNKEFQAEAKKAIALKFYADEKLSLGQATELAGISKFEFVKYLNENQVSLFRFETDDYTAELENELATAARYSND